MPGARAVRRDATAAALVAEARRQFAAEGYAAVPVTEIVEALGMTKGALYHHFDGKVGLFRAVVEQVHHEVGERVSAAAGAHADPWDQLVAGCEAFLAAHTDPAVRRIMLIDGPAVIGWREWRAMDEGSSARLLSEVLGVLIERGVIVDQPVEPLSHLLSGAMNEAALWLAETGDEDATDATTAALRRLLGSLRREREDP